jgi:hypothetical protein
MVLAIDFYYLESEEGECWCADECNCLESAGDDTQVLMTADWLEELPQSCDAEDEEDWSLYDSIEEEMVWTMLEQMAIQEVPIATGD